jgi:hypothetical protein
MHQSIELGSNGQQHHIVVERDPLRPSARSSSVPVRQMHITGYRTSGNVVVMLGNDIWSKERVARFSLRLDDLLPLAERLRELHALLERDLAGRA